MRLAVILSALAALAVLTAPVTAPHVRALAETTTAKSVAFLALGLVAIFGETTSKQALAGLALGLSLAIVAANVMTWLSDFNLNLGF